MTVRLIAANPSLTLFDRGEVVAYASAWRVEWSPLGAGVALIVWHDGGVRVVGPDQALGRWLAETYVRHFPEVGGLPWPEPSVTPSPLALDLDPATGLRAVGGGVELTILGPLERRVVTAEGIEFGGGVHGFSCVQIPCAAGTLSIDGRVVAGASEGDGSAATSSAFLAVAEVWTSRSRSRFPP